MKRLFDEAVETQKVIKQKNFVANPVPKHCTNCPYESVCEERQAQKAINSAKRNATKELKKQNDPLENMQGINIFTMGK
jgi:hypothetical protein